MSMNLPAALRQTADRLAAGDRYEWGHVGRCNCGHVVQTLTGATAGEIYATFGQELREWSEHGHDYCSTSGEGVAKLFAVLGSVGVLRQDVTHLENLTDSEVLARVGGRRLRRNVRSDVVDYLRAMADQRELTALATT